MDTSKTPRLIGPGPPRLGWLKASSAAILAYLALPAGEALAAGSANVSKLVVVADTRGLGPGITKWLADVYNTSYWQFAVLSVLVMAGMGLVLGFVCDQLIKLLGINLGRMEHHE